MAKTETEREFWDRIYAEQKAIADSNRLKALSVPPTDPDADFKAIIANIEGVNS